MSDTPSPELERQLAALTVWPGQTPGLWRRALRQARAGTDRGATWVLRVLKLAPLGLVAAAVVLAIVLPSLYGAREAAKVELASLSSQERYRAGPYEARRFGEGVKLGTGYVMGSPAPPAPCAAGPGAAANSAGGPTVAGGTILVAEGSYGRARQTSSPGPDHARPTDATPALDRQVIRKATMELLTKDVRAAFLRAGQLISEARGEYIEDSGLGGDPNRPEANLTFRVTAGRLPEILNELRQLGEVRLEKTSGEDVTTQVVDVEARLRNEQRVETELLQLLEKRQDAPLKEILELRQSIAGVRQNIEQLTAQREKLGRLVALATVLVIIRASDAPDPRPEPGLGAYLLESLRHAWTSGARFLISTLAGLVSVVVGGLVWWVLAAIAILIARAYWRRSHPAT